MLTNAQRKANQHLRIVIQEMKKEIKKVQTESGFITNPRIKEIENQITILLQAVRLINTLA
jgi:ribosomal protein S8